MKKNFSAPRTLSGDSRHRHSLQDARYRLARHERRRTRRAASQQGTADFSLWIEEPVRFHRQRYRHLIHPLHGKFHQTAAVVTCLVLILLGWRAGGASSISSERWLYGLFSGWFIVAMLRLGLFTCLAAPRCISYAQGRLHLSGLGTLHAGQILHWSMTHGVRSSPCARPALRLDINCRWLGCERHWSMLLEEDTESARLQQLLEEHFPRRADAAAHSLHGAIQFEAGVLSH